MARTVGDIIAAQIGSLSIERANALARAEHAEELVAKLKQELDALKQQVRAQTQES